MKTILEKIKFDIEKNEFNLHVKEVLIEEEYLVDELNELKEKKNVSYKEKFYVMRYLLKNDTDIQFIFSQRDFNKIDVETIFDILERTKLENTKDVMKIVGSKNIDRLPFYRLCLLADSKNIDVYDYLKLIK